MRSDEEIFTIVEGSKFTTIRDGKPIEIIAPAQLVALYKGNLLKLEEEANVRVIKTARNAKKQGAFLGIIGSVFTIIAGLIGKGVLKKK